MGSRNWSVYCLLSLSNKRSYVGATTDPDRRLKQHNGLLAGGAKATAKLGSGWRRVVLVSGFPDERAALQFEWRWKRLSRQARDAISASPYPEPLRRRLCALASLLRLERPTQAALPFARYPSGLTISLESEEARLTWGGAAAARGLAIGGGYWPPFFSFLFPSGEE